MTEIAPPPPASAPTCDRTSLRGLKALVIGGAGGIGSGVCEGLARAGAAVAFTWRSDRAAADALGARLANHGVPAHGAQLDILDGAAVDACVADVCRRFGGLTSLVYACGPRFALRYVSQTPFAEWQRAVATDVFGFYHVVEACLPRLREAGNTSITAITTAGVRRPSIKDALSAAPKSAITSLMHVLAIEEGRYGVRANCVAPGLIDAGFGRWVQQHEFTSEQTRKMIRATPLRRSGTPADIAEAVVFLCSPAASFITGNTLAVSGGVEL